MKKFSDLAKKISDLHVLKEGSPKEEASESKSDEAAEGDSPNCPHCGGSISLYKKVSGADHMAAKSGLK